MDAKRLEELEAFVAKHRGDAAMVTLAKKALEGASR